MRLPASFGSTWLLLGLFALGCAGASELAMGEGEADPPLANAPAVATPPPERATDPVSSVAANPAPNPVPTEHAPYDAKWADEVRSVIATYESWGRVDDEMRFAPWLCRMPMAASARFSESEHASTHGQKLYTLYAMDPVSYGAERSAMGEPTKLSGLSQVVVKEAFAPVQLADDGSPAWNPHGVGEHRLRPAEKDGRRFAAGERKGLYVMMKSSGTTEGTDAGWVYATVDADMTTVTAVGVIDSCADCHAEAGDDRLFGLPERAGPTMRNTNAVPL